MSDLRGPGISQFTFRSRKAKEFNDDEFWGWTPERRHAWDEYNRRQAELRETRRQGTNEEWAKIAR